LTESAVTDGTAVGDEVLDQAPESVVERATSVGAERLCRTPFDILITGLIGGVEVSLGGLAAAAVIGVVAPLPGAGLYGGLAVAGLVFPIGFFFVIMGRSELFTENFLIPVVGALNGNRPLRELPQLWGISWAGNLLGCAALASLLSVPHAIGASILNGYARYAAYKLDVPAIGTLVSAILAGITMTVLTWLIIALRHPIAKVLAIWAAGYVLFATNLSHAIVGAAMIFTGFVHARQTWQAVAVWLALSTAGNLLGGVALVTFFRLVQARHRQQPRARAHRGSRPDVPPCPGRSD
jgi:formate/nitrite transporter FocA (FNT family)